MNVLQACPADINAWMTLVTRVRDNFPGLETDEGLDDYRQTTLRFMAEGRALCVKDENELQGVLLFSKKRNMICCLAVAPEARRRGIASRLLETALNALDPRRPVTVTTFRAEDAKGAAPRALYQSFGFRPTQLVEEFGYPNQVFILDPRA